MALREGAKAYVTGDVAALGARYTISAQLVSAESGEVLAAIREDGRRLDAAPDRPGPAVCRDALPHRRVDAIDPGRPCRSTR